VRSQLRLSTCFKGFFVPLKQEVSILETVTTQSRVTGNIDFSVSAKKAYAFQDYIEDAIFSLQDKIDINIESLDLFHKMKTELYEWISKQLITISVATNKEKWPQWDWNSFSDDAELRIGLLTIYKDKPIPIHDHPGATGLLLVLEGHLNLAEYQLQHIKQMSKISCAGLSCVSEKDIYRGECAHITPHSGNIHAVSSESEACIVLDILFTSYDESKRNWYTPTSKENRSGEVFSTFCLNKN